ncbi:DUF1688 family protein [Derxia gummosa]|uniref:DUF1688 family protein n=1 Tax=Derxia gummosa DSM 723 TaxID=1121388 RepID=A0A9U5D2P9_9BURK|nr:DUF1688 family protein [Derxia gummosa]
MSKVSYAHREGHMHEQHLPAGLAQLDRAVAELRQPATIRARAANVLAAVKAGKSEFFRIDEGKLDEAAALVAEVTRGNYPTLDVPFHSRWRHFGAGGIDREAQFDAAFAARFGAATGSDAGGATLVSPATAPAGGKPRSAAEADLALSRARAAIDLALVSVLLDAGAGAQWRWIESRADGHSASYARSEGLGVASFHAFMRGAFSATAGDPLRVDAEALQRMDASTLGALFQVTEANPLVGIDGRATLLRRLGKTIAARPELFGKPARPGNLIDALLAESGQAPVRARDVLGLLLDGLAPIWPSHQKLADRPLGDCWRHPFAGGSGLTAGWLPIHKLSQWLTYSLLEPIMRAGVQVIGIDELTALAEYRNGGLLIDSGVIVPANREVKLKAWTPGDLPIIEWRALTIALMDPLADLVRARLGKPDMPLAAILEGGTWAAGRVLAGRLHGGDPPLRIVSDGTVF